MEVGGFTESVEGVKKAALLEDGFVSSMDDYDNEFSPQERWSGVDLKGSPSRTHKILDFYNTRMYVCPNNVGILILMEEANYCFINVRNGNKIKKGVPFMKVDFMEISMPFTMNVLEHWEHGCKSYIGIFKIQK